MSEKRHWVLCDCRDAEHQFLLSYTPGDDWNEVYLQVHLAKQSFWRRLKYLFGYQSKYGAFQETVIAPAEAARIRDFLNDFLEQARAA